MTPALRLGLLAMVALSPAFASADDRSDFVDEALARRIIGPDLGLAEVRIFAEERVPRMPEVSTREAWDREADRMRSEVLDRVVYRGEAANWRKLPTRVEWLGAIDGGPGYRIRKLRYEAVPGFWVPALLYEPEKLEGKVPAVLNFDGHDPKGMFADYKQVRCINLAKRGMYALNVDWIGMGELKSPENAHALLNHLDLCGTGGLAVFYSLQTRGVDVLLGLDHADPARIAATGLSGGGWQTIFLGAMDPRVALTAPVAGYSSLRTRARHDSDLGDSEQTPSDLATVTDYTLMTAMLAPRAALLTFNSRDDCCFASGHALPPLVEAAAPIFKLCGAEARLRTYINQDPGTHNYYRDNRQAFYKMVGDTFTPGKADDSAVEIPSEAEIKTADQLNVPLPADNATLHSIALSLSKTLPRDPALPTGKEAATAWQVARRPRLAEIIRSHRFAVNADARGSQPRAGVTARTWALNLDNTWTVPAVELTQGDPTATMVLVRDAGRKSAGPLAFDALARGFRVIVVDPYDVGESSLGDQAWLWDLYLAALGHRPIGLRASELAAIARWSVARGDGPVVLLADGPATSLAALVAAAIEPTAIAELELRGLPGSLKEPIESKTPFNLAPDRFCFGLLAEFDVPQILALVAPRRVLVDKPSPRARAELSVMKPWYATLGLDFNPYLEDIPCWKTRTGRKSILAFLALSRYNKAPINTRGYSSVVER